MTPIAGGPPLEAPDGSFTRARWVPRRTVEWVEQADRIMLEYGAVKGRALYDQRHHARHRAKRLIRLMVELRMHERWELSEHVEQHPDGYLWSVEYHGGKS